MSYDEKTDKMDWKNEYSWMIISVISGIVLSFLFIYDRYLYWSTKKPHASGCGAQCPPAFTCYLP